METKWIENIDKIELSFAVTYKVRISRTIYGE